METKTGKLFIRPTTGVYATYQRLSYKPWFALAEFVDNSTESYFQNREVIRGTYGRGGVPLQLRIEITYDSLEKTLVIYDNAFGMEIEDFTRALVLDQPPKYGMGRSEFGMGLKTAACWFGRRWSVKTTQFGSNRMLIAEIDVEKLSQTHAEEVEFSESPANPDEHYTLITIKDVQQPIRGKTVQRVWEQLSSMYREDLRSGEIIIEWNGTPLKYEDPALYTETGSDQKTREWKMDVSFSVPWERFDTPLKVRGWIGIRKQGKLRVAGLVLMRRGRVIVGGPDQGYRPVEVFGLGNSFRSQRLIGELHLDDWPVTQAKDSFDWADGLEDAFIEELAKVCKEYGDKAESIRHQPEVKAITKADMMGASEQAQKTLSRNEFGIWLREEILKELRPAIPNPATISMQPSDEQQEQVLRESQEQNVSPSLENDQFQVSLNELKNTSDGPIIYFLKVDQDEWKLSLYWQSHNTNTHWMQLRFDQGNEIEIYLNTAHPFFSPYLNSRSMLELLQKLCIALALAEKLARMTTHNVQGLVDPSDFRTYMNKILRRIADVEEIN